MIEHAPRRMPLLPLLAWLALATFPVSAQAATIAVTANAPDVLNGVDGNCALREAITNVNDGAATYADCVNTGAAYGTGDTINIPAGTYTNAIATTFDNLNANGDLDLLASVTITGAGASTTIIDGGMIERVLHLPAGVGITVSITGVTLRNGTGGIYQGESASSLTLDGCAISGNTSWNGVGIRTKGTTVINNSTISGNHSNGNPATAAGISVSGGDVTATNVTLSGNTGANPFNNNEYGIAAYVNAGVLRLINSTVSGNAADMDALYGNSGSGTIYLTDTIVAGQVRGANCGGAIISNGHNLDDDGTCGLASAGDLSNNAGANLGGLADNGGTTQTHALLAGSAALDAGSCNGGAVTADQRGISRPRGGACDIGAYEFFYPNVTVTVTGTGIVADDGALAGFGVTCPGTCTDFVTSGDSVTLTATPGAGQSFTGWSGVCSGTGDCVLNNITADKNVTATFGVIPTPTPTPASPDLGTSVTSVDFGSVTVDGSGSGTATITNSGNGSVAITGLSGVAAPFTIVNDGCTGKALHASGGSCSIEFAFAPTASGSFNESVTVTTNYATVTITLTGSGVSTGVANGGGGLTPPTLLSPADGATVPAGDVTFTWTPGGGTDELFLCDNADFEGCVATTTARLDLPMTLVAFGLLLPFGLRSRTGRTLLLGLFVTIGGVTACGSSSDTASDTGASKTVTLSAGVKYWKVVTTSGAASSDSEVRLLTVE